MAKSVDYIGGVDESGKGDFFGPLVIAAAAIGREHESLLAKLNVRDSKKLTDARALAVAERLRHHIPHDIVVIMPVKYNELYRKIGNLNRLLAWGHARALENLLARVDCTMIISDKFGKEELLKRAIMEKGRQIELVQQTRGEIHPPVAAASIIARAEFLKKMEQLRRRWKIEFPKGAASQVDRAGKKFVESFGEKRLEEVAKVHFKNMRKINDLVGRVL